MRTFSRRFILVSGVLALAAAMMVAGIVAAASARPRDRVTRPAMPASRPAIPSTVPPTTSTSAPFNARRAIVSSTTAPVRLLAEGTTGTDVLTLQGRLLRLGFWLRDEPGSFGPATTHAVVAFEKAIGFARDGIVDAAETNKLRTSTRFTPRSTEGRVFEVDLQRQLLLDVDNGRVRWVIDTSTGRIPGTTPTGHWQVYEEVDGWVHGSLGTLYRPKFFRGNVGIHGNSSVPAYPASHGCVRVFNGAMDWLWASGDLPMGTAVWVY